MSFSTRTQCVIVEDTLGKKSVFRKIVDVSKERHPYHIGNENNERKDNHRVSVPPAPPLPGAERLPETQADPRELLRGDRLLPQVRQQAPDQMNFKGQTIY